jgi:hypothetical protein
VTHSFPSVIWPLVIFRENFFEGHSSGRTGSNDTNLEFLSCERAEKNGGHTPTHRRNKDNIYRLAVGPFKKNGKNI